MLKKIGIVIGISVVGMVMAYLFPIWLIGIFIGLIALYFMWFLDRMKWKMESILKQLDELKGVVNDIDRNA